VREPEDNDNHSVASISQCGGQTMNQHHQLYTPQASALVFIDHQPLASILHSVKQGGDEEAAR
jgi:hypothetical protein